MSPATPAVVPPSTSPSDPRPSFIAGLGDTLTRTTERWIPDSWVICMMLTVVVLALAIFGAGAGIEESVLAWGDGMWTLLPLAMQLSIALITAHACVSSRPIFHLLERLAAISDPDRPRQAVIVTALYSLSTAYLNWALSIVASALFIPFVCRRNPKTDVRILVAAAYLGNGTVWHGGLSGSAPLILATPGNPLLAPSSGPPVIDRLVPVTETLFAPFNLVYIVVIGAVGLLAVTLLHPRRNAVTLSADQINAIMPRFPEVPTGRLTPAGRLDGSRGWTLLAAVLIIYPLGHALMARGAAAWNINAYNMVFLALALLLHGRPASFVKAFYNGTTTAGGLILQFPFYAGIFGVMQNTGLGAWMGHLFVSISSPQTFPLVVYLYSSFVNLFVPSGGSKWLIEAPYLLPAANTLGVSVGTTVLAYAYGDSTSNMIQPFWAIPILAVTRLRFGDVLGYTTLVFVACFLISIIAMLLIPLNL